MFKTAMPTPVAGSRGSGTAGGKETQFLNFAPYRADTFDDVLGKPMIAMYSRGESGRKNAADFSNIGLYDATGVDTTKPYKPDPSRLMADSTLMPHPLDPNLYSEIQGHHVNPAYRRKGLGRFMLNLVAQDNPKRRLIAVPDPFRDRAVSRKNLRKVYESYGFMPADENDINEGATLFRPSVAEMIRFSRAGHPVPEDFIPKTASVIADQVLTKLGFYRPY